MRGKNRQSRSNIHILYKYARTCCKMNRSEIKNCKYSDFNKPVWNILSTVRRHSYNRHMHLESFAKLAELSHGKDGLFLFERLFVKVYRVKSRNYTKPAFGKSVVM